MKAITYRDYGPPDVLRYGEVDKPPVGDDHVLIRVRAASLNPLDWHTMSGTPYMLRIAAGLGRPTDTRLGVDVAGEVEAVGAHITEFKPGDEVFGACRGAFAEYACASPSALVAKPANVTFEQAAAVHVAGMTALQGLRDTGHIQAGGSVLINGAAGGVGTFAVQIAKTFGAVVTAVCSTRNVGMVQSIGSDHVIDYTREDFTGKGRRYDLMLDCIGNHSLSACRRVLSPTGAYVIVGGRTGRWMIGLFSRMIAARLVSQFGRQRLGFLMVKRSKEDLTILAKLIAKGAVTPVIDRRYPLSEVAEAVRYLKQGHARGKVVITM